MLALKISSMKTFMNHLLVADTFDNFLLEEATISTANVYQIDGHINKEFFATDELTEAQSIPYDFSQWQDIKPLCFNLIKGKRTPLFFKFVLHLKPEQVSKLMAAGNSNISPEEIKALVLTVKYDGSQAVLTTASAFHTFLMSKEPDVLWDKAMLQFLTRKGIDYEIL
ncbi:MAG: hypothetical protein IJX63_05380 [Lachnospiraceae bacterium]|nr:hypothetical protein [Lachnospiraceae bacterium]